MFRFPARCASFMGPPNTRQFSRHLRMLSGSSRRPATRIKNGLHAKLRSQLAQRKRDPRDNVVMVGAGWFKRFRGQAQKLEEKNAELSSLKEYFLTADINRMKSLGMYNMHGAIEHIVYEAVLEGKIPPAIGRQKSLNELAQRPEFTTILHQEIKTRDVVANEATHCIRYLYRVVKEGSKGNDHSAIVIRHMDYSSFQIPALVSFFKMQDKWRHPLPWREDTVRGEVKLIYYSDFESSDSDL